MDTEKRFVSYTDDIPPLEVRKMDDGTERIEGYAVVFNSWSRNLGGFVEKIDPGAFKEAKMDDVVALFNHDMNQILGRTDETLKLSIDTKGVRYSIIPADTQSTRDLLTHIKRRDVRGSSFQFRVSRNGDTWTEPNEQGAPYERTINKIAELVDVSPVTMPAYEATDASVAKRALGLIRDKKEAEVNEQIEKEKAEQQARFRRHHQELDMSLRLASRYINLTKNE